MIINFLYSIKRIFVIIFFLMIAQVSYAQPGDPGGDPDVPITGIEILIGAGGALGIKKMLKRRKKTI